MKDRVLDLRDAVIDEESFVRFLKALSEDRADEVEKEKQNPSSGWAAGANGWQNGTIENFLEAAAAWAEETKDGTPAIGDSVGYSRPENP